MDVDEFRMHLQQHHFIHGIFRRRFWHRLHIDFADAFHHAMFLIVVDAYSKWPEIFEMRRRAVLGSNFSLNKWCENEPHVFLSQRQFKVVNPKLT